MSNVIPFKFKTADLRVITDEGGKFWFVAKDVADLLGYSDAEAMTRKLDQDELQNRQIVGFGNRGVNLVNESGLYSVVLTSKKAEAKEFKRWVTHEVLPSIRKTGSYSAPQQNAIPAPMENSMIAVKYAAEIMRWSETSKLRAIGTVCDQHGVNTQFLPTYSDEQLTMALGDLLKRHGSNLSARRANVILMELGYLEELKRKSSRGGEKSFKSISQKGLEFGKNETSPQSPNQTQPRYFVNTFPALLEKIEQADGKKSGNVVTIEE